MNPKLDKSKEIGRRKREKRDIIYTGGCSNMEDDEWKPEKYLREGVISVGGEAVRCLDDLDYLREKMISGSRDVIRSARECIFSAVHKKRDLSLKEKVRDIVEAARKVRNESAAYPSSWFIPQQEQMDQEVVEMYFVSYLMDLITNLKNLPQNNTSEHIHTSPSHISPSPEKKEAEKIAGFREMDVSPKAYLLGMADAAGEVRRIILSYLLSRTEEKKGNALSETETHVDVEATEKNDKKYSREPREGKEDNTLFTLTLRLLVGFMEAVYEVMCSAEYPSGLLPIKQKRDGLRSLLERTRADILSYLFRI